MTLYIKDGNKFIPTPNATTRIDDKLEKNFYNITVNPKTDQCELSITDTPAIPTILYGDFKDRCDMILKTYRERTSSTGSLFIGEKGNGKTLLMDYIALKSDLPVIVVNNAHNLNKVMDLLEIIEDEHVLIIDEVDKKYPAADRYGDPSATYRLLTYLSSNRNCKHLTLLGGNEIVDINKFLLNRPGRVFYKMEFNGVDPDTLKAILKDKLNDKSIVDNMLNHIKTLGKVSFDNVSALIEEINRYPHKSFMDIMKHINIVPNFTNTSKLYYKLTIDSKDYSIIHLYPTDQGYIKIDSIYALKDPNLDSITVKYKDGDGSKEIDFDFRELDIIIENPESNKLIITKGNNIRLEVTQLEKSDSTPTAGNTLSSKKRLYVKTESVPF